MTRTRRIGWTIAAAGFATLAVAACDNRAVEAAASTGVSSRVSSGVSGRGAAEARMADAAVPPRGDKTSVATDDASLTAKVKAAIFAEPGFDDLGIHVAVQDGTVTLSGQVDSAAKRERAAQIATQVTGVKNVVDQMEVKG